MNTLRKCTVDQVESNQNNDENTDLCISGRHTEMVEVIMKIIRETSAEMISIEEDDLKHAATMLRELEGVIVSKKEAYAMAAFIKRAQQGSLKSGKHLIILNDARSEIEVCADKKF